jgi:hypothetical protein
MRVVERGLKILHEEGIEKFIKKHHCMYLESLLKAI